MSVLAVGIFNPSLSSHATYTFLSFVCPLIPSSPIHQPASCGVRLNALLNNSFTSTNAEASVRGTRSKLASASLPLPTFSADTTFLKWAALSLVLHSCSVFRIASCFSCARRSANKDSAEANMPSSKIVLRPEMESAHALANCKIITGLPLSWW